MLVMRAGMGSTIAAYILLARPAQWIKNVSLLLPVLLSGQLFEPHIVYQVLILMVAFCFLSSSNYMINDLLDIVGDRYHPTKRFRPLATRKADERIATGISICLLSIGLGIAMLVSAKAFLIGLTFVLIHYLSYVLLRRVPIVDVLAIASGYILRIMAGEAAAGITMSVWLFLTVLSGSLLLAIGKRRSEFSLLRYHEDKKRQELTESFLYSEKVLDSYVSVFASAAFLSYAYFTFLSEVSISGVFFRGYWDFVFPTLSRKWMMATIPFVLFGIMRYVQLIYLTKRPLAEEVVADKYLAITSIFWIVVIVAVIYGIGG